MLKNIFKTLKDSNCISNLSCSMPPFFSIIMPTYNRASLIPKAINSVIGQTFKDWELIIVDDGSTDNTCQIIEAYLSDARIKYIYQHNQERCIARNNGINASKGHFITFLDSDDYFLPQRLELIHKGISTNNDKEEFYYTGICFEDEAGRKERKELVNRFYNKYDFIISAVIGAPQACIYHTILKRHQFDPRFTVGEDMELWLRIVGDHNVVFLDKQATYIASDHINRTVGTGKVKPYLEHQRALNHIISLHYPIDNKLLNHLKHGVTMSIARCYIYNENKRFNAILIILKSFRYSLKDSFKEKIYILLRAIKPSLTKK